MLVLFGIAIIEPNIIMIRLRGEVKDLSPNTLGKLNTLPLSEKSMNEGGSMPVQLVPDLLVRNLVFVIRVSDSFFKFRHRFIQALLQVTRSFATVLAMLHLTWGTVITICCHVGVTRKERDKR